MNSPSLGYTLMMTLALILPTLFSFALSLMSPAQTCREVVRDASRRIVQTIERQKQTGGSERAVIRDASGRITGQPDVPSGPNPDKIKQMVGKFDTGDQMNDVLVLTLSDFGRTVAENGTSGTDHGWANCMIAIGGGVAKNDKPVLGEWPGLAPENLYQKRDLKHTTDFRDVLGEVVSSHLGNENIAHIIPDHKHKAVG